MTKRRAEGGSAPFLLIVLPPLLRFPPNKNVSGCWGAKSNNCPLLKPSYAWWHLPLTGWPVKDRPPVWIYFVQNSHYLIIISLTCIFILVIISPPSSSSCWWSIHSPALLGCHFPPSPHPSNIPLSPSPFPVFDAASISLQSGNNHRGTFICSCHPSTDASGPCAPLSHFVPAEACPSVCSPGHPAAVPCHVFINCPLSSRSFLWSCKYAMIIPIWKEKNNSLEPTSPTSCQSYFSAFLYRKIPPKSQLCLLFPFLLLLPLSDQLRSSLSLHFSSSYQDHQWPPDG